MNTDKHRLKVRPNWSAEHQLGVSLALYQQAELVLGAPAISPVVNLKSEI